MRSRALLSVSNKEGLVELAQTLLELGWELVSTGGTARVLTSAGLPVIPVEEVSGVPEAFDGRMKTLSFSIESAILYDRANPSHREEAKRLGIVPIDLVICNLYPFKETITYEGVSQAEAIEMIDIGGPTMVRAAAKNFQSVGVVVSPQDYPLVMHELKEKGGLALATRKKLAAKAFRHTAEYDSVIERYLHRRLLGEAVRNIVLRAGASLRYGENPHQGGSHYALEEDPDDPLALHRFAVLQGKALSFNNYLDADSLVFLLSLLGGENPACVVIKHTNPCGAASGKDPTDAFQRAWAGDSLAAFGGVVGINRPVDRSLAEAMVSEGRFFEVLLAPGFSREAREKLARKKNLRLLSNPSLENPSLRPFVDYKRVRGGILVQEGDVRILSEEDLRIVTEAQPSPEQLEEMLFAWKVCQASKSNTIVITRDRQLVGSGVGQQDRLRCCRLAAEKAAERARGAVCASDGFFPFPDGPEALMDAGVAAILQPCGSIRDGEVFEACNHRGVSMASTGGIRAFKH
ncbi:MAG: bifunctional phosphoribosylaminoimidazolecarboxamide formyltransferase/IMP cyclohydrolase [Armatimonadetes bacterium]|nr:bifunctional phosphoribosylaminoimidazolecarboxamide formyltransferase/IMP cyclohydrolase [Armatimonadota bacterium]